LQLARGTHFAEYLADWVRGGGCLSAEKAAVVANECERLARTTERASWQKPNVRAKLTLYALLSASRRTADFIGRVKLPIPFPLPCPLFFENYSYGTINLTAAVPRCEFIQNPVPFPAGKRKLDPRRHAAKGQGYCPVLSDTFLKGRNSSISQ
jgi:hypothetical protein